MATLLWDFDETLAYRDGKWTRSMYEILVRNGYEHISEDEVGPHFKTGLPWHLSSEAHSEYFYDEDWWTHVNEVIRLKLLKLGFDDEQSLALSRQFREEYLDLSKWHLYEDTSDALMRSKSEGHTNIILSNHVPELKTIVKHLGIDGYFHTIISSADVGYDKPHPEIYKEALKHTSKDSNVYMIGDSYKADILGASAMGIEAIWVRQDNTNGYKKHSVGLSGIWQYIERL
ncbi:MAG: HAD family hydrolase [Clostridiales bacterium]|nr:HAD family hydrolase [Clostridiales bacterium]